MDDGVREGEVGERRSVCNRAPLRLLRGAQSEHFFHKPELTTGLMTGLGAHYSGGAKGLSQ